MKTIHINKQFTIHAPVDYVFPLVCPVMKYKWISGWKTKLVYCPNGKNEEGVIFKEKMSAPFIMGNAFSASTWKTLLHDAEYHKVHFLWDNKIATSIFKIEMYSMGVNQTRCYLKLNITPKNSKCEAILKHKGEYGVEFLLNRLSGRLKHFSEHCTALTNKEIKQIADFTEKLTTKEKLVFFINKLHLKLTPDRDKKRFLSLGTITERTLGRKQLCS